MTEPFVLEWMGGVAEHHYRHARPGVDDFAWSSLDATRYSQPALMAARDVWTRLTYSEYAAITAFSQVVVALTQARAPLDLIGMVSDFIADEVRHVELASHVVMQLGGAAARPFDPGALPQRVTSGLTPLQCANDLALRIGCIAEAFASRTVLQVMRATTHPLLREVYVSILRDEARHRRFGSLYFEWAQDRLDTAERARLGHVAVTCLRDYSGLWSDAPPTHAEPASSAEAHELGWLEHARFAPAALQVVRDEIVPDLRSLGLTLPEPELTALLSTHPSVI